MIPAFIIVSVIVIGLYFYREPWGRGHAIIAGIVVLLGVGVAVYWNLPRRPRIWEIEKAAAINEFCAEQSAKGNLAGTSCK